ncbi:hypothetical protein TNCV_3828281 [Trichonephila clavipes]|nr:hypothetical protein TNCV_3828281 [Trichonephila clavipes]
MTGSLVIYSSSFSSSRYSCGKATRFVKSSERKSSSDRAHHRVQAPNNDIWQENGNLNATYRVHKHSKYDDPHSIIDMIKKHQVYLLLDHNHNKVESRPIALVGGRISLNLQGSYLQ